MSERDWWKGDLIASILIVLLFAAGMWVLSNLYPPKDVPEVYSATTYEDAVVLCTEWEETPWDVSACQWRAYESFYGTDAARAAYETATEAR